MASTYRAVQASAAGDSLHHQLCKGPVSLPGLLVLLRSFAAPSPYTAETALQSGAADAIAVGRHSSNPDLPRPIARSTCACKVPQNLQVRSAWLQ